MIVLLFGEFERLYDCARLCDKIDGSKFIALDFFSCVVHVYSFDDVIVCRSFGKRDGYNTSKFVVDILNPDMWDGIVGFIDGYVNK